jgi:hypothetical protein
MIPAVKLAISIFSRAFVMVTCVSFAVAVDAHLIGCLLCAISSDEVKITILANSYQCSFSVWVDASSAVHRLMA